MIRHHNERVQFVPVKVSVSVVYSSHHQIGDFLALQKQRAVGAGVQEPIHSYECFAGRGHSIWREYPAGRKTAV